jgi:hypothetical protein
MVRPRQVVGRLTVLKIEIVNPTAPPINVPAAAPQFNGNEFTYSVAATGVLTIPVRVRIQPDTAHIRSTFQNNVRIRITAIDDSHTSPTGGNVQLSWDHPFAGEATAGKGIYNAANQLWEATATFTTLPPDNGDLGIKTVTVHALQSGAAVCTQARDCEVFFGGADNTTNHPGAGSGTTPNWFFFWGQTTAMFGQPVYDPAGANSTIDFRNNAWVAVLCPVDNDPYTLPAGDPNAGTQIDGIDNFAWGCRHEGRHVQTSTAWYPNGYNGALDPDGDWMPDAQEPALGGTAANPINGGPFTPGVQDTDGDGMRDDEDYTIATQGAWNIGSADATDWSNPGHQAGP